MPAVVIPGGGVVEGGEAAAAMQAEVAEIAPSAGTALLGPNCMGLIDLNDRLRDLHRRDPAVAAPRRHGRRSPVGQRRRRVHAQRHADRLEPHHQLRLGGRDRPLRPPRALPRDPETDAVVLFVEGFSGRSGSSRWRTGRSAWASRSWRSRSDGARRRRPPRSPTPARWRARSAPTDAAFRAAGVVRCDDLDDLLEAASLVEPARRLGRSVGRGRTGVVTVSTGEGSLIADLAARPAWTCRPCRPRRGRG